MIYRKQRNFELDIADFISKLNETVDMVFISNPNGTTSQVIDRESLAFIAKICAGNHIFLVVDEEYMDFVRDKEDCTAIPLVKEYDNIAVLRNTSKFFAVPGLRLAYMITSNPVFKKRRWKLQDFRIKLTVLRKLPVLTCFRTPAISAKQIL